MTIRKICGLTVGIMLVLFLLIPISTSAKENVQLKVNVDAGFSNQAKTLRSYPVTITIKNNGDDFQGDMVLTVPKDFSGFYNRVFHLKIPSGTTKEVKFTMPAFEQSMISDIQRGHRVNFLHIYDDKWQEGHEVDLGKAYDLMPLFGDPTQLYIGALTNNPDALNSLKLTNYQQQTPRVIVLSKDSFPDDGDALATLDTIFIGNFDIKTLSEKQISALEQWIQNGGNLIVGARAAENGHLGFLASDLPMMIQGETDFKDLKAMAELSNEPLKRALHIDTGALKKGAEIIYERSNVPLVTSKRVGLGQVIQVNFDLGDPTFSNWRGSPAFYENIFNKSIITNPDIGRLNETMNNLDLIAENFQTSSHFSFGVLFFLFIVYLLIITFALYFVLKRFDKREWSWIVIPVFAICCSLVLYFIGTNNRLGSYQARGINIMYLDESGYGSGIGSASFLSHSGGHYQLKINDGVKAEPSDRSEPIRQSDALNTQLPFVEMNGSSYTIEYNNVAFWSPKTFVLTYPYRKYGSFATSLTFNGEFIKGTIKNNTKYTIHSAAVYTGSVKYSIGTLKPGEEKGVSIKTTYSSLQSPYPVHNPVFNNNQFNPDVIMYEALNLLHFRSSNTGPMVGGFVDQPITEFKVNGKTPKIAATTVVLQPVDIFMSDILSGTASFELSKPEISGNYDQMNIIDVPQYVAVHFNQSENDAVYRIPQKYILAGFHATKLEIRIPNPSTGPKFPINKLKMDIYNYQTKKYELLYSDMILSGQSATNYVNSKGELKIQIHGVGEMWMPVFTVKGEVGND